MIPFLCGCLSQQAATSQVPSDPFGQAEAPPVQRQVSYAPASIETAARVDTLGRKLLAANRQIGVKPIFRTIGTPVPEVFHCGTAEVDVTEGLVRLCQNEGELAAVLCQELGKIVAEREALAGPQARVPEREPPQEVRIGTDNAGAFGPADQTHLAELAKFEKERPRPSASLPLPDPQALARGYLTKAGYAETELQGAAPILQAAAANSAFEKQFTAANTARPWVR
jgi:predicted Zn-dependent protease